MIDYEKWVIPQKGLLIRDPRTKAILPPVGMFKPWTGPEGRYWRRRVKDGTVIISTPPSAETEKVSKEIRRKK